MNKFLRKSLTTLFSLTMLITTGAVKQWGDIEEVYAEEGQHEYAYEMYVEPTCVSQGISHRYCVNHSKVEGRFHVADPSKSGYDDNSDSIKEYDTPATGKHTFNYKEQVGNGYRFYCQHAEGNPNATTVDLGCKSKQLFSQESGTNYGVFYTETISSFHYRVTEVVKSPTCSSVGYTQTYCVMHSHLNPTTGLYEYAESQDISNVGDPNSDYDKVVTSTIAATGSHTYNVSYVNGSAVYTCDFANKDPNCKTKVLNGKAGVYTVTSVAATGDDGSHKGWTQINNASEFSSKVTGKTNGNYILNADIDLSSKYYESVIVNSNVTVNLCLNGHTLKTNSSFLVNGGTLRIYDHNGQGKIITRASGAYTGSYDKKHANSLPGAFQNAGGTLLISGVNIEYTDDDDSVIAVSNGTTTLCNGTNITTEGIGIFADYNPNNDSYISGNPTVNLTDTTITTTGYENAIDMIVGSGGGKKFGVTVNVGSGCVLKGTYYYGVIRLRDYGTVNGSGTPGNNILNVNGNAKIINENSGSGVGIYLGEYGGQVNISENAYIEARTGILVQPYYMKTAKSVVSISGTPTIKSSHYGVSFERTSYTNYPTNNDVGLKLSGRPTIHGGSGDIYLGDDYLFKPYIQVTGALQPQEGKFKVATSKYAYSTLQKYPTWANDSLIVKANSTNYLNYFALVGKANHKLIRLSNNEIHVEECKHNFRDMEYQASTDTVDGYRKKICVDCNAIETETLKAAGRHIYGAYIPDGPNEHYRVCENDGNVLVENHRFVTYTDQNNGTHKSTCAECGYQKEAEAHTWGTTITKDSDGVRHYVTCTANNCGARNYSDCDFTHHYIDLGDGVHHDSYCVCGNKIHGEHTLVLVAKESREPSSEEDGIETTACICGAKKVRIPGFTSFGKTNITIPNDGDTKYPESKHSYDNNTNNTQTFSYKGAEQLILKFNGSSETESRYDKITIKYVKDGNTTTLINAESGIFKSKEYTIPADNFSIQLTSDGSVQKYGYAFEYIKATVENTFEEPNTDLLRITKPFVYTTDEDSVKGIYSIKTVDHLPTLNIRTAFVSGLDVVNAPEFAEETYQDFINLAGGNKVTTKVFNSNEEASAYKLDFGVPGYYAVRIKYQKDSEIEYNYQIIRVDVDTSTYGIPQVQPQEHNGSLTFTEDNLLKVYIGKTENISVIVKDDNGKVVGTTVNSYDGFITATKNNYHLKSGAAINQHTFAYDEPGYYLVRIKYTNKFGNTDYLYTAFEISSEQANHKAPAKDDDVSDGIIEIDRENSDVLLEKVYVGYLGEESKPEWFAEKPLDFTDWKVFTGQCENYFQVSSSQLKGYKFHATKPGWYAVRIKYTIEDKDQYKAFLYHIEKSLGGAPVVNKPEGGEKKLVVSADNSNYTLSKVYIGYAKDQTLTDEQYLTQMNSNYNNFVAMSESVKCYQGQALNNDGYELSRDGAYLLRIKYIDANNDAQYVYDVFHVTKAYPKKNLLVSVDANTVTLTLEEYKVKSVKFFSCDAFGVMTNQVPVLETTKMVNDLAKGLYVVQVVDEHNNNYQVQVNVKFEKVINENYITALNNAINDAKSYLSKVVLTNELTGAVKYDGSSVNLADGKIGTARRVDYNNYLESYITKAESVLVSLNNDEHKYAQEEVNKTTNNLNSALSTFKTKVVTNLVSVSGNTISSNLTVDGDNVAYMYVAKGIHLEYATMSNAEGFNKVTVRDGALAIGDLDNGVYTVRTKVTPTEGNVYYIYTYCYIGSDLVNDVKDELSKEINTTKTTKLANALDADEQLKATLQSNKAAVKLFTVFANAKTVAADSNSADECLFAAIDLIKTSGETASGLGAEGVAPQKDITFVMPDGTEVIYDYTANSIPTDMTVILAQEGDPFANVHIKATNILNYRIAYGEFSEEDGYTAMSESASGIASYTTEENTYKAKYNGIYTLRIKWKDSTYTYQTFEVEGIPEPLLLVVEDSNINAIYEGYDLGEITLVQYLYGSSVSAHAEYFTEFNADNGKSFEDMVIPGLGNGIHTFKITVVKPDGTNMTYYEQVRVEGQTTMALKQDETRIGFIANNVDGYQDVKYKELGDDIEFFHTSLNKMISADTFDKDKTYLIEVGSKNDKYVLTYLHNEYVLEPYIERHSEEVE